MGKGTSSPTKKSTCGKCGKNHYGDSLIVTDNCFGYGKSGHKVRNWTNSKVQDKSSGQAQSSGSNVDALKNNHFYTLYCRG